MATLVPKPDGYNELLGALVDRIRTAQLRAADAVNRELVGLYWSIGREILTRQDVEGWGTRVIERVALDLRRLFPDSRGFSERNLKYMRALAAAWPEEAIVQQLLHKVPWGHLVRIIDKVDHPVARDWYLRATLEHGWSRSVLVHQIDSKAHERQGQAITNFQRTLPAPQSDLAHQSLKDPYKLDFLMLADDVRERELEAALLDHLQKFLIELGVGFAFVGRQYRLAVGNDEFFLDLLFYHLKLRCFVVVELKATDFRPEYAGKLNFYLSAVDDRLRHKDDQQTIGLLLCRGKDRVVAEYALRGMTQPMGVSDYELRESLPEKLKGTLPAIEEIEDEMREPGS